NSINNTNDFSAVGPSNDTASLTAVNSSDMPNLEELTHSDDADDVGAEADINNLLSIISVSPIPTTRIHKDHLTSQIIGDLSSTTQTRSMARIVRDQDDVTRLQALVDRKKIVISEDVIREILQLDDAEGVVCLPNEEIFAGLAQMGYEKPCVENLEHDKAAQKLEIIKLKARVKRLEMANKVKSSKLGYLRKVGASRRIESSNYIEDVFNQGRMIVDMDKDEGIELAEIYNLDLDQPSKVLSMQEDNSEVQEVVEVVTTAKLVTDVVTAASQDNAASATISAAKPSIPVATPTVVAAYTRRRKGVIIKDPKEELSSKTPTETLKLKNKGKGILVETPKPMKKKDQIELDAKYARKLHEEINKDHEEINKDIDWDAEIDHINQKSKNP
nr:hypothetical protein [Tanacetum cinerariifolium]